MKPKILCRLGYTQQYPDLFLGPCFGRNQTDCVQSTSPVLISSSIPMAEIPKIKQKHLRGDKSTFQARHWIVRQLTKEAIWKRQLWSKNTCMHYFYFSTILAK